MLTKTGKVYNMDRNEKIVGRQRDRTIASILDFKERACDEFLPEDVSKALRKHILDNINDLTNLCLDLLDGAILNDDFVDKIEDIHKWVMNELTYGE